MQLEDVIRLFYKCSLRPFAHLFADTYARHKLPS